MWHFYIDSHDKHFLLTSYNYLTDFTCNQKISLMYKNGFSFNSWVWQIHSEIFFKDIICRV